MYVEIDTVKSFVKTITTGAQQGSISGLLRFLININHIFNSSNISQFTLFSGNTNLFNTNEYTLQVHTSNVKEWIDYERVNDYNS